MKTILLVEDDPFTSEIYSTQFKKGGFLVDVANNVSMALEKVKNTHPDLLVLDLNLNPSMPGPKDGLDILRAVRQEATSKNLKVIVISNYNEGDYPELAELSQLGIVKYFLKIASTPEEILTTIQETLK